MPELKTNFLYYGDKWRLGSTSHRILGMFREQLEMLRERAEFPALVCLYPTRGGIRHKCSYAAWEDSWANTEIIRDIGKAGSLGYAPQKPLALLRVNIDPVPNTGDGCLIRSAAMGEPVPYTKSEWPKPGATRESIRSRQGPKAEPTRQADNASRKGGRLTRVQ